MKILGYSERGIVTSLFYEIAYSENALELLSEFLRIATFPFCEFEPGFIEDAEIIVEQSFSDFGDLDALLLISGRNWHLSIFIEAKVKPFQTKIWNVNKEWDEFIKGTTLKVSSSNLFTQIYHKVRLVEALNEDGIRELKKGIKFPNSSSKSLRKIGNNEVVMRAVKKIEKNLDAVYYLALVPESPENLKDFFKKVLCDSAPSNFIGWDVSNCGYLSWVEVEGYCNKFGLENTLNVFNHNRGQIY